MKRAYIDYLQDMLDNAKRAGRFTTGMDFGSFSKDDKTEYAVIRAVEIIGEAARNIPQDVRSKYPQIPWRDVAGMRDNSSINTLESTWKLSGRRSMKMCRC